MADYDLLADLKEWAESYDAVEIGADGVLYNAIHRIEELEAILQSYKDGNHFEAQKKERAALGEKKDA
jgi:hypothetical protein